MRNQKMPSTLPTLSGWRLYKANPHNELKLKGIRRHISFASIYSITAVLLFAQLALYLHDRATIQTKRQAYDAALSEFESSYKERLLENKSELSRACTAWWFDMSHKDRKLDVPVAPKKK